MSLFRNRKIKENENKENIIFNDSAKNKKERPLFKEKNIKKILSMDGVDPNPLSYMVINDHGIDCYVRTFYIHTMPKNVQFATSFAPLFDYENSVASVFMFPVSDGKSIRHLDRRIVKIESEWTAAAKDGDRNRMRKMRNKLDQTEVWVQNIENGNNTLFEVGFLFTIFTQTLEELNLSTQRFVTLGRNKGIELCSCYGVQPEAFLSNAPFNHIYSLGLDKRNYIKSTGIKMHIMDKYSLATIFHHTNSSFSHKKGIPAGRNMHTAEPILYDPYDHSHDGYGIIFSGKTGTGKSATMKMYISRLYHQHYAFVSIDSDRRGGRGEFSTMAERLSGINYVIKNGSKHRINPFDIDKQLEWDEPTDTEIPTLRLRDKVSDLTHIVMSMICSEDEQMEFSMSKAIKHIISTSIATLYEKKQIFDGQPESVYEKGEVLMNGQLVDGLVKKPMPTFSDLYMQILFMKKNNTEPFHEKAFTIVLDAVGDWVNHIIFNKNTLEIYTDEMYQYFKEMNDNIVNDIVEVKGTKSYFDGQSTIALSNDTSYTNIDISSLPKDDIPVAQQFACDFVNQNFMQKNSENPKKARKLVVIVDEAHRMFRNKKTALYLEDWYRTARKRHVSVWTCTQALKDFAGSSSTESIKSNATSIFLFKQDPEHANYLRENTILSESQVAKVIKLGGDLDNDAKRGECCLIDNNRCVFLKVDYLSTERYIVETNVANIKKMYT